MKKYCMMLAGIACLLVATTAAAQQWTQRAKVYVPFEFTVANTVLPAGTYAVMVQPGHNTAQIMFRNVETHVTAVAHNTDLGMQTHKYAENSNLIFVKDAEGQRVLHQVWLAGETHGHDLTHEAETPEPR